MSMSGNDKAREERIYNEAIVDAYGDYEQAASWHCYLEDRITFPFTAECIEVRSISPLKKGEKVKVIRMADQDDCLEEMFVMIDFMKRTFGVPLAQLKPLNTDEDTREAMGDWHYWVGHDPDF